MRKELQKFLKQKQLDWHQENIESRPNVRMTQRAFARWLGIPEQTLSDLLLADREPSPLQLHRISKRYPEVYEVIGRPDLADYGWVAERKQKRLNRIAQMWGRLSDQDAAKIENMARTLALSSDDDQDTEGGQRPFEFATDATN